MFVGLEQVGQYIALGSEYVDSQLGQIMRAPRWGVVCVMTPSVGVIGGWRKL